MANPIRVLGPIAWLKSIWYVWRDKETPRWSKVLFGVLAVVYLVSPLDFLPDLMLPGVGFIDDVVVVTFLTWFATKFAPEAVRAAARRKAAKQWDNESSEESQKDVDIVDVDSSGSREAD